MAGIFGCVAALSERGSATAGPGCGRSDMSLGCFQSRPFGEQVALQFREDVSQFFQIDAVFKGRSLNCLGRLGRCGLVLHAIGSVNNLAQQTRKIFSRDAGTVFLFRPEAQQCGTETGICLLQDGKRAGTH